MGAFDSFKFSTMRNIFLCPEPEACAVFTVQDMVANGREKLVPVRSLPPAQPPTIVFS